MGDDATVTAAWAALETLADPEIPVITLRELGIVRDIRDGSDGLEVVITPTYSGCPAMSQIEDDIRATLARAGFDARVVTVLTPPWTTDWITASGKEKLRAYGIAPPQRKAGGESVVRFISRPAAAEAVPCPRCGSTNTTLTAAFGSTACKALYACRDCREPFDYFKPH